MASNRPYRADWRHQLSPPLSNSEDSDMYPPALSIQSQDSSSERETHSQPSASIGSARVMAVTSFSKPSPVIYSFPDRQRPLRSPETAHPRHEAAPHFASPIQAFHLPLPPIPPSEVFNISPPDSPPPDSTPHGLGINISHSHSSNSNSQSHSSTPSSGLGKGSRPSSMISIMSREIKHEVMLNYLYQEQCSKMWVSEKRGHYEGVILRKHAGVYMACPPKLRTSVFAQSCAALNLKVAMTVSSGIITTFLQWAPHAAEIPLNEELSVQVIPSMHDFVRARKNQFSAFIASENLLVVWDDEPTRVVDRAKTIVDALVDLVWTAKPEDGTEVPNEKGLARVRMSMIDEENGEECNRTINVWNATLVSLTLWLVMVMLGAGFRAIAVEIKADGDWTRLLFLLLIPVQIFFTLFFAQVVVGCLAQLFGPVAQMNGNSKFYSAILPPRLCGRTLPHVTIQCPVYKEGLATVIGPTIQSIKRAMSTYELQGGTANLFVNDDGLQVLPEDQRQERIQFYHDHGIGWTARPPDGANGFVRRGKFKKASNMNFGLIISNRVEEKLQQVERPDYWSQADEDVEYSRCMREVLFEDGQAWADGNIRLGDYILLIDSDTRVPDDCFLDAVSEMERSLNVGILQFSSGVMQVVSTYFEDGVTFFTNLIYTAIKYTVSNGDVAPFVGHNAILRWSAIQSVAFTCPYDGTQKYWSEDHVSEDFDMSLRLQVAGYIIRLASWAGDGFKEGVSLTVYDELARWEKYAYGCNEILFHPVKDWLHRGPFTPRFLQFITSDIRFTSKITILAYMGMYYAIGAAWLVTTANYFAVGWFNGYLDHYYIDSWKVWFSILIVFNGLANLSLAVMRYRTGNASLWRAICENFKWIPMLAIFLGGLSLHVSQALLSHMFSIDMAWTTTSKEVEETNFFTEAPRVIRKFKWSFIFGLTGVCGMIFLAYAPFLPYDWQIRDFVAVLPMGTVTASHLLLPVALNPALMMFSF